MTTQHQNNVAHSCSISKNSSVKTVKYLHFSAINWLVFSVPWWQLMNWLDGSTGTRYLHTIVPSFDAFTSSWSSSCNYFKPDLFWEGIIVDQVFLLLLATVSDSLLLFRIADWQWHQEAIKCAFLQESSSFLLVSASSFCFKLSYQMCFPPGILLAPSCTCFLLLFQIVF